MRLARARLTVAEYGAVVSLDGCSYDGQRASLEDLLLRARVVVHPVEGELLWGIARGLRVVDADLPSAHVAVDDLVPRLPNLLAEQGTATHHNLDKRGHTFRVSWCSMMDEPWGSLSRCPLQPRLCFEPRARTFTHSPAAAFCILIPDTTAVAAVLKLYDGMSTEPRARRGRSTPRSAL